MILFGPDEYSLDAAGFKRACAKAMAQGVDLKVDESAKGTVLGECQIVIPDGARLHIDGDNVEFLNSSLEFKAAPIATPKLCRPVSPGDKVIYVTAENGIQPGHYLHVEWGLQGGDPYTDHNEIAQVADVAGGQMALTLEYPIVHAVKPNRELRYVIREAQSAFVYRTYWADPETLIVRLNGEEVPRAAYTVTNDGGDVNKRGPKPWIVTFHTEIVGELSFSTDPVKVPIFGRGELLLENWKQTNDPTVKRTAILGTVPIGSRFRDLDLTGHIEFDAKGWPKGDGFHDLFRVFGLGMDVNTIHLKGARYGLQTSGRASRYRNISGTDVFSVVEQSASSEGNEIEGVEGFNCVNLISGHRGGFSKIRNVHPREEDGAVRVLGGLLLRTVGQDSADMGPFDTQNGNLETGEDAASFSAGTFIKPDRQLADSRDDPIRMRRGPLSFRNIQDPGHRIIATSSPRVLFDNVEFGEINSDGTAEHYVDEFFISNSRVNLLNLRAVRQFQVSRCELDHLVLRTGAGAQGGSISDCRIGRADLSANELVRWRSQLGGIACLVDGDSREHPVTFERCSFISSDVPLLHPNDRAVQDGYTTDPPNWTPESLKPLRAITSHRRGGYVFEDCEVRVPIEGVAGV